VLTRDDVVDLKRQVVEMLRHPAVLAGMPAAAPNEILNSNFQLV